MKSPLVGFIRIESHRAKEFVELLLAVVEKVGKMIMKSGKC
jgi:hypothetical protein